MKTISWMLMFSMVFYCCYDSYTILHNQADYSELNETLDDEKALITLINDTVIVGENVNVELDSIYWFEPAYTGKSTTTNTVPTWAVRHVEIKSSWKGFLNWWTVSAIIIAVPVAIILYNSWKESDDYDSSEEGFARFAASLIGLGWGSVGGIPFGIIGSQKGFPERYNLIASQDSTNTNIELKEHIEEKQEIIKGEEEFIKEDENFIEVEVSSIEVDRQIFNIIWQGKKIRLSKSQVKQRRKAGDKLYITISKELYESEFKEE